jgi:hypothetical protein
MVSLAVYNLKVRYWNYLKRIGIVEKWQTQVKQTELTIEPSTLFKPGALIGDYHGRSLRLTAVDYTVQITLFLKHQTHISLLLKAGEALGSLTKRLKTQTIQVGDESFDRQFLVQGQPEQEIINILTSSDLRGKLIRLSWQGSVKIKIANQQLSLEQPIRIYLMSDAEYLQNVLDLLSELAEAVEKAAVYG